MNYRWTKWSPLPPIQLAFLVMALYYQIYCPSWLTCLQLFRNVTIEAVSSEDPL